MLSIDRIASADKSFIEYNLEQNGLHVSGNFDEDKVSLLRAYMIYLPPDEQEYVYTLGFDDAFIKGHGSMDIIKGLMTPSDYECGYKISTMSLFHILDRDELRIVPTSITKLYQIAQVLDIDVKSTPEVICEQIKLMAPSIDWQIQNALDTTKFNDDTKRYIRRYLDTAHAEINSDLRSGGKELHLNKFIDTLQPIDRDIYVLRHVYNRKFPETGIFRSLGYLSTSIAYETYLMGPRDIKETVMRILVPKGKKAIFIPGHESELIFSHDIELEVLKHYKKDVFNKGQHYVVDWYDMKML